MPVSNASRYGCPQAPFSNASALPVEPLPRIIPASPRVEPLALPRR